MVLDTIFEPLAIASLQKSLEQTMVLDSFAKRQPKYICLLESLKI